MSTVNDLLKPFLISGRVTLVTGASSGIGRHFGPMLARAGARVVLAARRIDPIVELRDQIIAEGGEALAVAMDVTDPGSISAGLDEIEQAFGVVTIVVNNAGITIPKPLLDLTDSEWTDVIDTNLSGAAYVTRETARRMIGAGVGGSIVNIASILAERVQKMLTNYAAAKAGLAQFSRTAALELAEHDIRVNTLSPGYVITEMNSYWFETDEAKELVSRIPQKRTCEMNELDGPLLLLASDAGSHITGANITVDGGHVLSDL